ncbi:hypothetical protein [Methylophaga sp.]|uniref:hypothetical protein n=1 Tax=Methylophaga sp. TaxID=2024840 RepID=UPI00271F6542|nr:hypothetical protein [Methylophaga sp.]MDO8828076.1 hypothetical protein [Methylophaga sp.]
MNVWAINKAVAIKLFLIELVHRYGENMFYLDGDSQQFQAVEIYSATNPDISVYVYTFAQPLDKYAVDLKYPLPENDIIGENENLSLEQLISIVTIHFELTD